MKTNVGALELLSSSDDKCVHIWDALQHGHVFNERSLEAQDGDVDGGGVRHLGWCLRGWK